MNISKLLGIDKIKADLKANNQKFKDQMADIKTDYNAKTTANNQRLQGQIDDYKKSVGEVKQAFKEFKEEHHQNS